MVGATRLMAKATRLVEIEWPGALAHGFDESVERTSAGRTASVVVWGLAAAAEATATTATERSN